MTNKYWTFLLYASLFIIGLFILVTNPFFGFLYFLFAFFYIRKKQQDKKKQEKVEIENTVNKGTHNPNLKVAEYKRACNECGKIWHSLVEREKMINPSGNCCDLDSLGEFNTCGTNSAQAQYRRNIQSREDALSKLRKCPNCSSTNYTETVIYYEKK